MRAVLLYILSALAVVGAETNASATSTSFLSLDWVLSEITSNNPSLKAVRANWRAMMERIPQARAWEDLRAGVDVERNGTVNPVRYSDTEWMLSQELPVSGKNRLRAKIATSEAASAFLQVRQRELALMTKARTAYFKLANAWAQYDLNVRNRSVWRQFSEITRKRYEVGTQTQADVLMAETELARIEETLISNANDISEAQSQLNVLMNRLPTDPLEKPAGERPIHYPFTLDQLQQIALEQRPELQIAEAKVQAATHQISLARKQWIPDPEVRVEARQVKGAGTVINEYDTGVFIKIPWVNRAKYKAGVREAEEMRASAENEFDALRQETLGLVNDQWKKLLAIHHHYELSRDRLLPLARQTVTSRLNTYGTEKGNFLELLTAQLTLQELESMHWNHLTDYQMSVAELGAIIGIPLDKLPSTEIKPPLK
jgi:outer membrane protein, heavy metal efflux system